MFGEAGQIRFILDGHDVKESPVKELRWKKGVKKGAYFDNGRVRGKIKQDNEQQGVPLFIIEDERSGAATHRYFYHGSLSEREQQDRTLRFVGQPADGHPPKVPFAFRRWRLSSCSPLKICRHPLHA